METLKNKKKCEDHCPNCGASMVDVNWLSMESDTIPYMWGTCKKCNCEFREEYTYNCTMFTLGDVPRVPCTIPMNKFYNFMDEVPKGERVSTPEDCAACVDETKCEDKHCLIGGG